MGVPLNGSDLSRSVVKTPGPESTSSLSWVSRLRTSVEEPRWSGGPESTDETNMRSRGTVDRVSEVRQGEVPGEYEIRLLEYRWNV